MAWASHKISAECTPTDKTNLEKFPIWFAKTYAASSLITDSAASATALACGVKTYNGAIGVNTDTMPV